MTKVLTPEAVRRFEEEGHCGPVRVLSEAEAARYRACLERVEANHPNETRKLKTKAHLLCPWVGEIARHPRVLDAFEDLLGPDILCYSTAFRIKPPDGRTFAGWHQDSAYSQLRPIMVLGALGLSDCTPANGCLRVVPGSHRWGALAHEEAPDPDSILARGQRITTPFDSSGAVDLALAPGEIAFFHYAAVHASGPNRSAGRRVMLLLEMMPASTCQARGRESAMLVRGEDRYAHFEADPRPRTEFGPEALAAWQRSVELRARTVFATSALTRPEAYGGPGAA